MNIVANAEGAFLTIKAEEQTELRIASDMLEKAIDKYEEALSGTPNSKEALANCAMACYEWLKCRARRGLARKREEAEAAASSGEQSADSSSPAEEVRDAFFILSNSTFVSYFCYGSSGVAVFSSVSFSLFLSFSRALSLVISASLV